MTGKIFYRERSNRADGSMMPRYELIAVQGMKLDVYGQHLRMSELKAIADATGSELIEAYHQQATESSAEADAWDNPPRTLETLLIEASGKAQFLLDAEDADAEALLSIFSSAEREVFISLLTRFVDKEPKHWVC